MPTPRTRSPPGLKPDTYAGTHDTVSTDDLGTYAEGELLDGEESMQDALSAIEPLSDRSLKAINNLAKYKPPPDPCELSLPTSQN